MTNTLALPYATPSPAAQAEHNLRRALNQVEEALAGLPEATEVWITATPRTYITLLGSVVRRGWSVEAELSASRRV